MFTAIREILAVFDWMTWSIWTIGFVIMVVWTLLPLREFRQVLKRLQEKDNTK